MLDKSYSYSMSFKAVIYYLFKKKNCPVCSSKLIKINNKTYAGLKSYKTDADITFSTNPYYEEYNVKISYKCEKCQTIYSLEMLATGEEDIFNSERSAEEIALADKEIKLELEKVEKNKIYMYRFFYGVFFFCAFIALLLKMFVTFAIILIIALILMAAFEMSYKK